MKKKRKKKKLKDEKKEKEKEKEKNNKEKLQMDEQSEEKYCCMGKSWNSLCKIQGNFERVTTKNWLEKAQVDIAIGLPLCNSCKTFPFTVFYFIFFFRKKN